MDRFRTVRTCTICTENNPVQATRCTICGEHLGAVAPSVLAVRPPRGPLMGTAERVVLGAGLGMLIAWMLMPAEPVWGKAPLVPVLLHTLEGADDGLDQLMAPLTHQSFMLILLCGIIAACLAAIFTRESGSQLLAPGFAPVRRRPCPHCSEMIVSQASLCRYCRLPVAEDASRRPARGAAAPG